MIVLERRDSHASFSHEPSLEPTSKRREELGKHSIYTHFPKDLNFEICQRTKITRAPCRRRIGGAVLRAENVGVLITADHEVLSANCEYRNIHRYAVVVQESGLDENWWADSMECYTYLSNVQDLLSDGKTHMRDVLGNHLMDRSFRLVHWLSITL